MENETEIVVHIYSGTDLVQAKRIPKSCLEKFTRKVEQKYAPPVDVRVVA